LFRRYPSYDPTSVKAAVQELAAVGLLISPSDRAREDTCLHQWEAWGLAASYFHFATKDAEYFTDQQSAALSGIDVPAPPSIFKSYPDARRIWLPRVHKHVSEPFLDVLLRRRTHRQFTAEPIPISALSSILFYTFAPMRFIDARQFGTLQLRTSPSGGARHELEAYVLVRAVSDVTPGIYHYDGATHALELRSDDVDDRLIRRIGAGQQWCIDAAFLCAVTGVLARTTSKYRHPRAYRVIQLNAGHLAQTFALTCTALGLGAFQTAAFHDSALEEALGVNGLDEAAIYLLGAGLPLPMHDGLAAGTNAPRAT
jgi:SagB-type dehydrogenase family enzyme